MSSHLDKFINYLHKYVNKNNSIAKTRTKSKSSSDFNTLYSHIRINFIKNHTGKYNESKTYYNNQAKYLSLFNVIKSGEGIVLFFKYKTKKYVYKIIYNIHSDYDILKDIQNKMAAKKLSPKIYKLFMEPEKFGDTNIQKLMKKKRLVFIIMEYIDSMELREYYDNTLKNMKHDKSIKELNRIIKYLNKFLKELRSIGICHLDFTLDNILYSKTNKKYYLIDYGWMKTIEDNDSKNCIESELDFILNSKRPYYRQRMKSLIKDFNKDFNTKYKLRKNKDNYLIIT